MMAASPPSFLPSFLPSLPPSQKHDLRTRLAVGGEGNGGRRWFGRRPQGIRNCECATTAPPPPPTLSTFALVYSPSVPRQRGQTARPAAAAAIGRPRFFEYVWTWERAECVVLYSRKEDEIRLGRRNRTPEKPARAIWLDIHFIVCRPRQPCHTFCKTQLLKLVASSVLGLFWGRGSIYPLPPEGQATPLSHIPHLIADAAGPLDEFSILFSRILHP